MVVYRIGYPKPRPQRLDRDAKKARLGALDREESAKVKVRSGGRCEIFLVGDGRCARRASQVHHMLSGWGRRARGDSALMEHKQHACATCHGLITGHVYRVLNEGRLPQWDDAYERDA